MATDAIIDRREVSPRIKQRTIETTNHNGWRENCRQTVCDGGAGRFWDVHENKRSSRRIKCPRQASKGGEAADPPAEGDIHVFSLGAVCNPYVSTIRGCRHWVDPKHPVWARGIAVRVTSLNHARTCRSMGSPTVSKTLDWRHMDQERTHATRDHPGRAD